MKYITTIGIDLAKTVFQVAILNSNQKLVSNKALSRSKLRSFIAQQPIAAIGMEACGSAHYWARTFETMGHSVKLLPTAYVKGFVYGNKHDVNDAKAIALAAIQKESPTVNIKTSDQLALQAVLRIRERRIKQRTESSNQIRGLLYEHGMTISKGHRCIKRLDLQQVPEAIRSLTADLIEEFIQRDKWVERSNMQAQKLVKQHPVGQQLLTLPGFGVINTLAALVINPNDFRNGRHYAAYLGCVPKQVGTGGKTRTLGLSKRGNRYHRQILCHGARSFLIKTNNPANPLWQWAKRIQLKKGTNVAVGALANKLARISWHILMGEQYHIDKAVTPLPE